MTEVLLGRELYVTYQRISGSGLRPHPNCFGDFRYTQNVSCNYRLKYKGISTVWDRKYLIEDKKDVERSFLSLILFKNRISKISSSTKER